MATKHVEKLLEEDFPRGVACDMYASDLPDDEMEFGWTDHYEKRRRERDNPKVTDEIVDELINDGMCFLSETHENRYLIQKEIDGRNWTLVVGNSDHGWALISIYCDYHGSDGTTRKYFERKKNGDLKND